MEKCCSNPYYDCDRWLGCFIELAVRVPDSYQEPYITFRLSKWIGKTLTAKIKLVVSTGWAVIDTTALPEGFLNPYTGAYKIEFLDNNGIPYPFVAKNGNTYLSASFDIMPSSTTDEIAQLNFIDNLVY